MLCVVVLYAKARVGIKGIQSNASSVIVVKYFLIVLLTISTWAFACGWAGVVLFLAILRMLQMFAKILLANSLPPSVKIWSGIPNLQIQFETIAAAIVVASLLFTTQISAYFVNASVIHKTCALPSVVFSGPNRSQCIRWLGSEHMGKGCKGSPIGGVFRAFWHLGHSASRCFTSTMIDGQ